jgi:small subunit ribosomal protein S21
MLIVEIKKGNIEKGLKELKSKVIKTKQNLKLVKNKEFTKPSVIKRSKINKSTYIQKMKTKEN